VAVSKEQRQMLIVGGVAVGGFLLYRMYQNNAAAQQQSSGQTATTGSGSASDYAALAGQEQSDAASLQAQNAQLANELNTLTGQETTDIAGVTKTLTGLDTTLTDQQHAFDAYQASEAQTVAGLASGEQSTNGLISSLSAKIAALEQGRSQRPGVKTKTQTSEARKDALQARHRALTGSQGLTGKSAAAFLHGITSGASPYKKKRGTTQKGGASQTGVYTRRGHPSYRVSSHHGTLVVHQVRAPNRKAKAK
jgi:hypothetical protein